MWQKTGVGGVKQGQLQLVVRALHLGSAKWQQQYLYLQYTLLQSTNTLSVYRTLGD